MRDALNLALKEELARDPSVFLMGEEVAEYQGAYKVTRGLLQEFGPKRVIDTPISESAIVGAAIGASLMVTPPWACWDRTWNRVSGTVDNSRSMTWTPLTPAISRAWRTTPSS
jgi:pyruvate dehydrogenase E1 component beta subunit